MNLPVVYELNKPNHNGRIYKDDFYDLLVKTINEEGLPVRLYETPHDEGPGFVPRKSVGKAIGASRDGNKVMVEISLDDTEEARRVKTLIEDKTVVGVGFNSYGDIDMDGTVHAHEIVSCSPLDAGNNYVVGSSE